MAENSAESVVFIAGGAVAGTGVSATVGGMGLVGGFGAVGIGMAPVTAAGAVAGAATYGAFKAIAHGDAVAFGAITIGALGGATVCATVGGMGLAGGFGGVSIGMGSMAAAGGVVGLGLYGIAKLIDQAGSGETAAQAFDRMEEKVLWQDAYTQALMELDPELAELAWKQKFAALEVEEELKALKAKIQTKSDLKLDFVPSTSSNSTFTRSVTPKNSDATSAPPESQFTSFETEAEIVAIEAQPPQTWRCVKVFKGHKASVNAIAISPDGQTLASGSDDRTVNLWNLKTGKRTFTFFGQAAGVHAVAISLDGKMLVAGGFDNKITSWQLDTKALLRPFFYRVHTGELIQTLSGCSPLAFSPDGKTLVSGGERGTIKLWRQMLGGDEFILDPVLSGEWWEVLGVDRGEHPKEVKLAYRRLARQYHPDINRTASAIATMQAINKAYEAFLKEFSRYCV
jgi:hypothetical protein